MFSAPRILAYLVFSVMAVLGVFATMQLSQEEGDGLFIDLKSKGGSVHLEDKNRTANEDPFKATKVKSFEDLIEKVKEKKSKRSQNPQIQKLMDEAQSKSKLNTIAEVTKTKVKVEEVQEIPKLVETPHMTLNSTSLEQGKFFVVKLAGLKSSPRLWFNSKEYQPFKMKDGSYRALVPIENLTKPGTYSILARTEGWEQKIPVTVRDNNKAIQYITLDETKSGLQATQKELSNIGSSLRARSFAQLWRGRFIYPSTAPKSSPFGVKRSYNRAPVSSYHKGLDFAGALGSTVVAPAAGKVVLVGKEAEGYVVHGNVVIIDHGHALTSIYMHLNTVSVQQGQQVTQGQQLGTIGHTGISTGPHLHWGTYLYGVSFDPELIVSKSI